MEKLKPCPFCGGEARIINRPTIGTVSIECIDCSAMMGRKGSSVRSYSSQSNDAFFDVKSAIEAWNRRVSDG